MYVFCVYLRTNSKLCHLQHKLVDFYSRNEKCLQRGTDVGLATPKPLKLRHITLYICNILTYVITILLYAYGILLAITLYVHKVYIYVWPDDASLTEPKHVATLDPTLKSVVLDGYCCTIYYDMCWCHNNLDKLIKMHGMNINIQIYCCMQYIYSPTQNKSSKQYKIKPQILCCDVQRRPYVGIFLRVQNLSPISSARRVHAMPRRQNPLFNTGNKYHAHTITTASHSIAVTDRQTQCSGRWVERCRRNSSRTYRRARSGSRDEESSRLAQTGKTDGSLRCTHGFSCAAGQECVSRFSP
jgi:hypothetical protein